MSYLAYIGLGANLGERANQICLAAERLSRSGVEVRRCSSLYESSPVGPIDDQPDFLNAVIEVQAAEEPAALLDVCLQIEQALGRRRQQPMGPRCIDLNLLLAGSRTLSTTQLTIPHPGLTARAFVLVPLLELAPDLVDPRDGRPLERHLEQVCETQQIRRVTGPPFGGAPMTMLSSALLVGVAYLAGAVPFGLLVGRARDVDLRQIGSGNIGATNVGRALGARWAVLVALLDAAKGFFPLLLARRLLPAPADQWSVALCMLAAVLGHVFPVFLCFRGGKGVATGLGVTLAIAPVAAGVGLCVYGLVFALVRISAVGSLAALAAVVATAWWRSVPRQILVGLALIAGVIVVRHHDNLRRLARGSEVPPRSPSSDHAQEPASEPKPRL